MMTFAEAQAEVRKIAENDRDTYIAMRKEATDALVAELRDWLGEDHGQDIGSSDVSIKVIEMYRFGELEV